MCVCVLSTFEIYCVSNFHVYNTVLLTVVTLVYFRSPELHLLMARLYSLTNISPFPSPLRLCQPPFFFSMSSAFIFLIPQINEVIQCFSLTFHLELTPSASIHVVANSRVSFFLRLNNIPW